MTKIILRLLFVCLIFFCDLQIFAQQQSSVDSVAEMTGDLTPLESLGDTLLVKNKFKTDDFTQKYKHERDFAYMKYLDSLLRKTKNLTVDTFSVGNFSSGKKERSQTRNVPRVPKSNIFNQPVLKIILWILAIFLIGFIIYKLFLGERFFKRNRNYKNTSESQKEGEEISDPSAYDKLIAQAVINKNYRLAIRYAYLQTLQMLAGRGLLQFSADKTNYQYLDELRGKPYQNDFAAITLHYEYVWYGKFEISEDVYHRLSEEYKTFNKKIFF